jgi:hypothetical protein
MSTKPQPGAPVDQSFPATCFYSLDRACAETKDRLMDALLDFGKSPSAEDQGCGKKSKKAAAALETKASNAERQVAARKERLLVEEDEGDR